MNCAQAKADYEVLLPFLRYDPGTGDFRWLIRPARHIRIGDIAGSFTQERYRQIKFGGKTYFAHRLAWLLTYGEWPVGQIDHINGIKHDNRIVNLREVTSSENIQAIFTAQSNSATGLRGTTQLKATGRFQSRIAVAGKRVFLGDFETAEQAHAAYIKAKAELHPASNLSRVHFLRDDK